jgi:hypothetical protein
MTVHVALNFAPRVMPHTDRRISIRKRIRARILPALRPIIVRPIPLTLTAVARIEDVLMAVTFLVVAGLGVIMEAAGTSLF